MERREATVPAVPISKAGGELISRAQQLADSHAALMDLYERREKLNAEIHMMALEVGEHRDAVRDLLHVHGPDEPARAASEMPAPPFVNAAAAYRR